MIYGEPFPYDTHLDSALTCAQVNAYNGRRQKVTPTHMLYGILGENCFASYLVEKILARHDKKLKDLIFQLDCKQGKRLKKKASELPDFSMMCHRAFRIAEGYAFSLADPEMALLGCDHLLLGITILKGDPATKTLAAFGITYKAVAQEMIDINTMQFAPVLDEPPHVA